MKNDEMQQIILRMKERRLSLGLTYQALADKTGMSKSTLQRYETGFIKNLSVDKLNDLAVALETTPSYLMGWEESSPAKMHAPAGTIHIEYRDLNSIYVEEEHDKDELMFKDSKGNIVDVRRGVKEMFRHNEDWANVAFQVSRELGDDDLEILKGLAEKFLELKRNLK